MDELNRVYKIFLEVFGSDTWPKLIKSEFRKKIFCFVRGYGLPEKKQKNKKKNDAKSLPSGKAKLYDCFFSPFGQVEWTS